MTKVAQTSVPPQVQYLTKQELAAALRLSTRSIERMWLRRELPYVVVHGRRRTPLTALERELRRREVAGRRVVGSVAR